MPVVYNKRLSSVECSQLIACTPLTNNSAITVMLVCLHSDDPEFWCKSDNILSQVIHGLKSNYPFVCVQSTSYRYHVVYRITFLTSQPFNFPIVLDNIKSLIDTNIQFYFK